MHRDSEIIMESEIQAGFLTVGSHATLVQICQNKQSLKTFAHRYVKQNIQILKLNTALDLTSKKQGDLTPTNFT